MVSDGIGTNSDHLFSNMPKYFENGMAILKILRLERSRVELKFYSEPTVAQTCIFQV